jgi:hypothetical protein
MAARVAFGLHVIAIVLLVGMALDGRAFAAGELDPAFGTGGKAITSSALSGVDAKDMLIKSDDGIVVAGGVPAGNILQGFGFLARYATDGNGGIAETAGLSTHDGGFRAIVQQADGKLVAVGFAQDSSGHLDGIVARFGEIGAPTSRSERWASCARRSAARTARSRTCWSIRTATTSSSARSTRAASITA